MNKNQSQKSVIHNERVKKEVHKENKSEKDPRNFEKNQEIGMSQKKREQFSRSQK